MKRAVVCNENVITSSVINGTGRAYYYYVLPLLIMDYYYNPSGEYVKDGRCHLVVIKGTETGDENSRDLRVREEIKKSNETHVFGCPYYDRPTRVESPTSRDSYAPYQKFAGDSDAGN